MVEIAKNESLVPEFDIVDWNVRNYFKPAESRTGFFIPPRAAGRHFIQVAIRWYNPWWSVAQDPIWEPTLEEVFSSYYYAVVLVNDEGTGNDARGTINAVPKAIGSWQYIHCEEKLRVNDRVELRLWQGFDLHDIDEVRAEVHFQIRSLEKKSSWWAPAPA